MNRYFKSIILIASCFVIIIVGVVCGKKNNAIVWATPFYIPEKTEQLINDTLKRNGYDVNVNFILFDAENYYTQIKKEIEKGKIDILFCGLSNWNQIGSRYELNDSLVNLKEYFITESGMKLYNSYPERIWDAITINDEIYWVSSGGNLPIKRAVLIDKTLQEKYALEKSDIDYTNLCKLAKEKINEDNEFAIQNHSLLLTMIPNVSFVCSPFVPLIINEMDSNLNVEILWENAQFVTMYNEIKELNSLNRINWDRTGNNTLFQIVYYTTEDDFASMGLNTENMILLENAFYNPLETIGTYVGIAETSGNKELAFEILAEIYTSAEYSNIFAYGEEGVDYEVINGHAVMKGTHEYLNPYTVVGNMFLMTPTLYQGENRQESYYRELDLAKSSKLLGFVFDGRSVKVEMKRVTDVVAEFYMRISNNPESLNLEIDDWQSKLKAAGIEEIKLEVERQLKNWRNSQNVEAN